MWPTGMDILRAPILRWCRRGSGTPPPIFSPPFPATDWPIGGTPLIGAPDTQTYPLMQAVNENKIACKWYG